MSNQAMTYQERVDIYKRAFDLYGGSLQIDVAIEELAGLINALMKYRRFIQTKAPAFWVQEAEEKVIEELASVTIMQHQIFMIFPIDKIEAKMEEKLQGLKTRIERDEKANT